MIDEIFWEIRKAKNQCHSSFFLSELPQRALIISGDLMMSIRIWYNSSSLNEYKNVMILVKSLNLPFQVALHAIHMDTLAYLEDVLGKWRINDEYLPRSRHERRSEQGRDHEDNTDVEDDQVGRVAPKKAWHHFLLEQEEPVSFTVEDIFLHVIHFFRCWTSRSETLRKPPIIVGHVFTDCRTIIAHISQLDSRIEGRVTCW